MEHTLPFNSDKIEDFHPLPESKTLKLIILIGSEARVTIYVPQNDCMSQGERTNKPTQVSVVYNNTHRRNLVVYITILTASF